MENQSMPENQKEHPSNTRPAPSLRRDTTQLVITSLFIALTFILGLTHLGIIPLGFINVTILCIPVIIGTITLGPSTGLLLGACFGLASTLRAFGIPSPASGLVSALMAANPAYVVLMSLIPRLLVPLAAYFTFTLTYGALRRRAKANAKHIALPIAAACASVTNTVFYLGLMLLFYMLSGLDHAKIITLITGTGLIAGSMEALAAALIAPAIISALWRIKKPYIWRYE